MRLHISKQSLLRKNVISSSLQITAIQAFYYSVIIMPSLLQGFSFYYTCFYYNRFHSSCIGSLIRKFAEVTCACTRVCKSMTQIILCKHTLWTEPLQSIWCRLGSWLAIEHPALAELWTFPKIDILALKSLFCERAGPYFKFGYYYTTVENRSEWVLWRKINQDLFRKYSCLNFTSNKYQGICYRNFFLLKSFRRY